MYPAWPTAVGPRTVQDNSGFQAIPQHYSQWTMKSGNTRNSEFEEVFKHTVNTLLQERVHGSWPTTMLAVEKETPVQSKPPIILSGKRKRNQSLTTVSNFSPAAKTSDKPCNGSGSAVTTKSVDVQAGPSLILSINSVSSRSQQEKRHLVDENDSIPPPKTVKIAPFNHTSFSNVTPSDSNQPEIASVAGGGLSTLCHAVPVPDKRVPYMNSVQSSPMVPVGNGAFVTCVPSSCPAAFSSELLPGQTINCGCATHIRQRARSRYRPSLQHYGASKYHALLIDSDDEEVTIIEEPLSSSKVQSPTVSSAANDTPKQEMLDVEMEDTVDSPGIQITEIKTLAPSTTNTRNTPVSYPRTHTPTLSHTQVVASFVTDSPRRTDTQMVRESHLTPTSPRHRARLSADFKTKQKPSSPAVRTLDLTTSTTSSNNLLNIVRTSSSNTLTIVHTAAKFTTSDRRKAIERAEISSATSAITESSASSTSSKSEENEGEGVTDPDVLLKMLKDVKRERPFKKLRVSPKNLYQAVKAKNFNKVLALIVEGCQPNEQVETEKGRTALHAAAAGGYLDIITCLKMANADLNVLDYDMRTPLFDAVENGRLKTVQFLMDCGASIHVKDQGGMTLLHVAARRGHNDIIHMLLDTGKFDVNQKDDGGWTAIMWAAEDKMVETAKLLLERHGNVHLRDLELNIPLHWAAFAGSYNMALLLLDNQSDLHSVNRHGETPLHVAARENNFSCVQLFINRGARIDLTNNEGQTPLDVALPETKSRQLLETKQLLLLCQPDRKFKMLSCDISRGQENVAIPCVNEVDDEPMPLFTFVKECCEVGGDNIEWNINTVQACFCDGDCGRNPNCSCGKMCDEENIWYDKDGLLNPDIHTLDRPLVFECNKMCKCWSYCRNRVVQKGMQYPLQLYKTKNKGWAVRALCQIPKGVFLCEYTGELISDSEADMRSDTYLFDLDCKESDHMLYCIDGDKYGNISRFINHSCEPNCIPTRVFIDHQDIRFPRIAFFSSKDIEPHEEICFNYGDRFWEVKRNEFFCECGTPSCNYKAPS